MLEAMAHAFFVYRQPKLAAAAVITLAFVMLVALAGWTMLTSLASALRPGSACTS